MCTLRNTGKTGICRMRALKTMENMGYSSMHALLVTRSPEIFSTCALRNRYASIMNLKHWKTWMLQHASTENTRKHRIFQHACAGNTRSVRLPSRGTLEDPGCLNMHTEQRSKATSSRHVCSEKHWTQILRTWHVHTEKHWTLMLKDRACVQ